MKLAASDYDGTLFRRGEVSREDLEAIAAWREMGHLFGLATGRDLNMTSGEIINRKIPVDFIICNTGASLYEPDFTPIHMFGLPPSAVSEVLNHPATRSSRYLLLSRANKTYINKWSSDSWLAGLGLELISIEEPEARRMSGVLQIGLEYDAAPEARRVAAEFNRDFGRYMKAHQSGICVDLVAAGVDKGEALALLIEMKGWRPEEVLTFGDSENDLSMLARYQGYAMENSPEEVIRVSRAVIPAPAALLRAEP